MDPLKIAEEEGFVRIYDAQFQFSHGKSSVSFFAHLCSFAA
jgi:hypothetical protein